MTFTSGGTEGNNLVLQGYPWNYVVTTQTEHTAVCSGDAAATAAPAPGCTSPPSSCPPSAGWTSSSWRWTAPPRRARGRRAPAGGAISLPDLERVRSGRPPTERGLVSLMYVNNEIGTVHDLPGVAACLRRLNAAAPPTDDNAPPRVALHTDAVQAPGHVPLDVQHLGVDFLTLSAHKFHVLPGAGGRHRPGRRLVPLLWCRARSGWRHQPPPPPPIPGGCGRCSSGATSRAVCAPARRP